MNELINNRRMDENGSLVEDNDSGKVSIKRESSPSATIVTKNPTGLRRKAGLHRKDWQQTVCSCCEGVSQH
jgi:hypothetical protein